MTMYHGFMTLDEQARLAIKRLLIELEYADQQLGDDRHFTRSDTMGYASAVLARLENGSTEPVSS